jgi:hypothetical protein
MVIDTESRGNKYGKLSEKSDTIGWENGKYYTHTHETKNAKLPGIAHH